MNNFDLSKVLEPINENSIATPSFNLYIKREKERSHIDTKGTFSQINFLCAQVLAQEFKSI